MTTTPTTTKFLVPQAPPQSWKEALDRHCRQHACLQASLSQLLLAQQATRCGQNSGSDNERQDDCYDDDEFEVPWALPTPSEIVTPQEYSKLDVVLLRTTDPSHTSLSSTSTPRKVFNAARSLVGGIYATVKQWTTEEEDEYWHEPESAHDHSSSTEKTMVSLTQPMVHVTLTRDCLSALLEHAAATAVSSSSSSLASDPWAYRRPPWTLVARSEWASWARPATTRIMSPPSSSSAPQLPPQSSLSSNDLYWLLDVLVANRHARILHRSSDAGKPDVIVFSTTITTTTPGKDYNKKTTAQEEAEQDSALQIPLALFDLQHSMKHIEAQLEQWTHQVHVCSQKALSYKQKQPRLALAQLARRKLLQEHIDSQSRTLLQLERVYHSIDMAQSNQVLLSLLSESSSLLHQLSSSTSVQDIDEIQDSIQDSMEQVDDMNMALTTMAGGGSGSHYNAAWDDEDLLLAELASLTIADKDILQGTLRHEPKEEDHPPAMSQSLAFQDTASSPVTTTTTTSHRRPKLPTTDTAVPSS
jgi:Snf7